MFWTITLIVGSAVGLVFVVAIIIKDIIVERREKLNALKEAATPDENK